MDQGLLHSSVCFESELAEGALQGGDQSKLKVGNKRL